MGRLYTIGANYKEAEDRFSPRKFALRIARTFSLSFLITRISEEFPKKFGINNNFKNSIYEF
jgi:hypothetical protein